MSTPVLLKSSSGIQTVLIESKLLSDRRRIFITDEINADSAMDFFKQIMLLNLEDDKAPISVLINTLGGEIDNRLLIYDCLVETKAPIRTFCSECAYSMGAVLFTCGQERFMFTHSKLMLTSLFLATRL